MSIKYRPEIDGLRAIAVIAVILYHAKFSLLGIPVLSGGFIGVDIFFVISGYLITSVILRDMDAGAFRFTRFYERRARRILPAFLFMMLCTLPFAWMYIMPKGLSEYAGASLSALGFGANFWFWLEDSYTAEPSLYKPMLHSWTLAVEEQFYILFPIFLMGAMCFARKYLLSLLMLGGLISLQIAEYMSAPHPDATFYLLHTRGWELLAGAILAKIEIDRGRDTHPLLHQIMPAVGLFLIMHALISFEDTMRHPSFMTAIPVLGTMILIWFCRSGEVVSDVLSTRVFVCIGLLSYSLYLWHYPIFAFARIDAGVLPDQTKVILIGLTFMCASISYLLVERPMRYHLAFKPFAVITLAAISIIAGVNIFFLKTDGAKFRLTAYEGVFGGDDPAHVPDWKSCFEPRPALGEHCKSLVDNPRGTIIAVGDSHMAVLGPTLRKMAARLNMNYEQFPRCVLIKGTEILKADNSVEINICAQEQLTALAKYENAIVVKTSRLSYRITGEDVTNTDVQEFADQYVPIEGNDLTIEDAIAQTNEDLLSMGYRLIQIYPVPEPGFFPDYRLRRLLKGHEMNVHDRIEEIADKEMSISYDDYMARHKRAFNALDRVSHSNYHAVKPHEIFCDKDLGICRSVANGRVLYRDTNHVSDYGARIIVEQVEEILEHQEK